MLLIAICFAFVDLSVAFSIYLSPQHNELPTSLSVSAANNLLLQHLNLDILQPWQGFTVNSDRPFVGMSSHGILLALEDSDVSAVLPSSLDRPIQVQSQATWPPYSMTNILSSFVDVSRLSYSAVFDDMSHIDDMSSILEGHQRSTFTAFNLNSLAEYRKRYGERSSEYDLAAEPIRRFLRAAMADPEVVRLAVIAYPDSEVNPERRELDVLQTQLPLPSQPSPQEPIEAISTCFSSFAACDNITVSCSGHGQCVEATKSGRSCFVCACTSTKTGQGNQIRTDTWVGERCERKDISGPFVLLTGTVIVLLLTVAGSILLLLNVGRQQLPSTLLGGAVSARKD